jgi:acetoin utilization deacetylase AcuC-like enzyme
MMRNEGAVTTLYLHHPIFLEHQLPSGHPERPERLLAIATALSDARFEPLERRLAPAADLGTVTLAHDQEYVDLVSDNVPSEGFARFDLDTFMSPKSLEAALHAVGAACHAVDEVMVGRANNAFCAVRPPGHHAESRRAMGFCLFNSAVIGARHAQRAHGAARVAIVDWDVHHGNGTQEIVWSDPTVFYASTHQMPLYPGTGAADETGVGNIFNVPLSPGAGSEAFHDAFGGRILPALTKFRPDLIVISAGFDAHRRDPLAAINLVEEDFAWATEELMFIADRHCSGRIVSLLEGGYDLEALAASVAAHVASLMKA